MTAGRATITLDPMELNTLIVGLIDRKNERAKRVLKGNEQEPAEYERLRARCSALDRILDVLVYEERSYPIRKNSRPASTPETHAARSDARRAANLSFDPSREGA